MQLYCEECGAKLEPGARFCENCGAKIEDAAETSGTTATAGATVRKENVRLERGIIYTDVGKLAAAMSASTEAVNEILRGFVASSISRGVDYAVFTAAGSSEPNSHVSAIKTAAAQYGARFVFIIGSWDVVPQIRWRNPANDRDEVVPSDLPYSVLSTADPANGVKYDFDSALRVGRLPVYSGENLENFRTYFENVTLHSGKFSSHVTFGETAKQWEPTSKAVYSPFRNGDLVCSPEYTYEDVSSQIPENANLLFFNVHGSEQAEYWYGQQGSSYPQAFAPKNMRSLVTPNFVGVEACYGAKYNGYPSAQSIVEAALETNCLGLFGSSKIAFGVPGTNSYSMSCADIIVGEFLKNIASGMMSGDAAAEARKVFWSQADDDTDMKTMMEFDLYGDPTARMKPVSQKAVSGKYVFTKAESAAKASFLPPLNIAMPDITKAIHTALARTDAKINEQVNREVWGAFKEFDGVEPQTYSVRTGSKTRYKNVYAKTAGGFDKNIIAYFEGDGTITKMVGTK